MSKSDVWARFDEDLEDAFRRLLVGDTASIDEKLCSISLPQERRELLGQLPQAIVDPQAWRDIAKWLQRAGAALPEKRKKLRSEEIAKLKKLEAGLVKDMLLESGFAVIDLGLASQIAKERGEIKGDDDPRASLLLYGQMLFGLKQYAIVTNAKALQQAMTMPLHEAAIYAKHFEQLFPVEYPNFRPDINPAIVKQFFRERLKIAESDIKISQMLSGEKRRRKTKERLRRRLYQHSVERYIKLKQATPLRRQSFLLDDLCRTDKRFRFHSRYNELRKRHADSVKRASVKKTPAIKKIADEMGQIRETYRGGLNRELQRHFEIYEGFKSLWEIDEYFKTYSQWPPRKPYKH